MLTMQNLCSRYNLSERALRRRVAALGTVITPHIGHGQNNTFLIADGGLAILDRLAQIQRETGLGLSGAAERVRSELANGSAVSSEPRRTNRCWPRGSTIHGYLSQG